jgi:hypothetical protein
MLLLILSKNKRLRGDWISCFKDFTMKWDSESKKRKILKVAYKASHEMATYGITWKDEEDPL